ncbi:hypothetical protein, partial [Azospirillum doebereinerae]|uniref:hypothetical protein n=1 Tax=Azospirillum doebereinerae TaxID=92933 RepID=UPI001B3BC868
MPFTEAVAVTVKPRLPLNSAGGVSVKPESCAPVSVQVPSPLSLPADSTAPAGTPAITTLSTSPAAGDTSALLIV